LGNTKYFVQSKLIEPAKVFFDDMSSAAITIKYNQINAELTRNKNPHDKIPNVKGLFSISHQEAI